MPLTDYEDRFQRPDDENRDQTDRGNNKLPAARIPWCKMRMKTII